MTVFNTQQSSPNKSSLIARKLKRRMMAADLNISLFNRASDGRQKVERYISENFYSRYSAHLDHFLPVFLALQNSGVLCGAVGLQRARTHPLFLEQYLAIPVEQKISMAFQRPVDRHKIVEIGNLVATRSGGSYLIFALLAATLHQLGFHWMIFTATEQVEKIIQKMGFKPLILCDANPELLCDGKDLWGSYYATKPKVMAGYLPLAFDKLINNSALTNLIEPYMTQINDIVQQLEGDRW